MHTGTVSPLLEPTVSIVVTGPLGQSSNQDVLIDTGFSGCLTLPPAVIAALGLTRKYRQRGLLADGSVHIFDVFEGTVILDAQSIPIEIECIDVKPLLGMQLLHRRELRI